MKLTNEEINEAVRMATGFGTRYSIPDDEAMKFIFNTFVAYVEQQQSMLDDMQSMLNRAFAERDETAKQLAEQKKVGDAESHIHQRDIEELTEVKRELIDMKNLCKCGARKTDASRAVAVAGADLEPGAVVTIKDGIAMPITPEESAEAAAVEAELRKPEPCRHKRHRLFVFEDEEIRCLQCEATAPLTVKQFCDIRAKQGTAFPDLSTVLEWSAPREVCGIEFAADGVKDGKPCVKSKGHKEHDHRDADGGHWDRDYWSDR